MSAEGRSKVAAPKRHSSAKFPRTRRFSYETPERLKELERNFVLDGAVLSRLTNDETGRTNPSLNFGIPQYRAKDDKHCKSFFASKALPKIANDKVRVLRPSAHTNCSHPAISFCNLCAVDCRELDDGWSV